MVGVPKSTGCVICRRRKIKCDETWPTCTNCHKNGKDCPGPPSRHTFKDLGPALTVFSTVVATDGSPDERRTRLTQLNEKWSTNGAVFQKFRISDRDGHRRTRPSRSPRLSPPSLTISRHPSPSQVHELVHGLVNALNTGSDGHRMSELGQFIREVPARIGHNAALDAAVACLINVHSSMVHKKENLISPSLYLRAIQTLQTCFKDQAQAKSPNTLCASVLLGLVEALAGPRTGNRYLTHVGGAGRLLEIQGPGQCHEPFAKEILRFNRGGIIITSIYERRQCFLATPEWRDTAFDKTGLSFDDCLYTDILQRMSELPALLRELKDLDSSVIPPLVDILPADFSYRIDADEDDAAAYPDSSIDLSPDSLASKLESFLNEPCDQDTAHIYSTARVSLLNKLYSLKDALSVLGTHLNANIKDGSAALELPSTEYDSPIPTAYRFTNWRVTVAYNCFWSLIIITNKIITKLLPPFDPSSYGLEAECRSVAFEICKTWEDAWARRPIGAFHTGLSFVMAYEFCTTEVKQWILNGLNALLDNQGVKTFQWSDEIVNMMSGKLTGEGPDLVFTQHRGQK